MSHTLQWKKDFLTSLAHELRNPLATVLSSVELLRLQGLKDADETTKNLDEIQERVHAMAAVLNDSLDMSELPKELHDAEMQTPEQSVPHNARTPFRILIVDDNVAAADALGKLLTLRGNDVQIAYTGAEALESVAASKPQVVVLDIGLPDIDGYAVARKLREEDFKGTLVALTGYGQDGDKERSLKSGFDFHLTKPISFKDIEAILGKLPASPKA